MHAYTHVAHKSVAHTFLRGPGLFSCLASMLVVLFGETSIHSAGCAACLLPRFFAVWCLAACEGLDFELTLWQPDSQRLYPWPRLSKPWLLQYPSSKLACALQVIESLNDTEWGSALDSTTCHTFSILFILARCQDTLGKLGLAVEGMVRVAFEPVRQSVLASARQLIVQGLLKYLLKMKKAIVCYRWASRLQLSPVTSNATTWECPTKVDVTAVFGNSLDPDQGSVHAQKQTDHKDHKDPTSNFQPCQQISTDIKPEYPREITSHTLIESSSAKNRLPCCRQLHGG